MFYIIYFRLLHRITHGLMGDLPSVRGLIMMNCVNTPKLWKIDPDVFGMVIIFQHAFFLSSSTGPHHNWHLFMYAVASLFLFCPSLKCVQCGPSHWCSFQLRSAKSSIWAFEWDCISSFSETMTHICTTARRCDYSGSHSPHKPSFREILEQGLIMTFCQWCGMQEQGGVLVEMMAAIACIVVPAISKEYKNK